MSVEGTGISAVDMAILWGGAITILAGVCALAWRAVRGALHLGRRVHQVIDDWYGEEERPGVPGRAGLMERVGGIEERLSRVEHELYPNSGESLRDAVDLANRRLARLCPDEEEPTLPDPSPTSP